MFGSEVAAGLGLVLMVSMLLAADGCSKPTPKTPAKQPNVAAGKPPTQQNVAATVPATAPAATSRPKLTSFWAPAKHDANGNLLPRMSYGEFITRGMNFLLKEQDTWASDNRIVDDEGKTRPPYFFYCVAGPNGQLHDAGDSCNRNQAYPAGHHGLYIVSLLAYYVYSGDEEALRRAEELGQWNLAHSTPKDWLYSGVPYSTVSNGRPPRAGDGTMDGESIIPIFGPGMGGSYLQLYRVTGKDEYLKAATHIADTMAKTQLPEGNWPFRVEPKTGKVKEQYTSAIIGVAVFFENLDNLAKTNTYAAPRQNALNWILNHPVKDMHWGGLFEDVGDVPKNRTNGDCMETAAYLIRHRDENKEYLPTAMKLLDWVKATFVDETGHMYAPAPATREQLAYNYRMCVHTGHWAALLAQLYEVTGEAKYLAGMKNACAYITYHMQADNRICVGPELDKQGCSFWYSMQFACPYQLINLLAYMPEEAPDGENHLIKSSAVVQKIRYEPASVAYTTDAQSSDLLKLAFAPKTITVNGKELPAGDGVATGWKFDGKTSILRLSHIAGNVVIAAKS